MDGAAILISAGAFTAICLLLAIGANDAADAIATSVGSNALNPNAAVILAALSQFAGASLAGRRGETPISKAFDSTIGTNGDVDIRGSFLG
jgi:inorganic phosphate transporter, PiT family